MLLLSHLENFVTQCQQDSLNLENSFLVATDDQFGKLYHEVVNANDNCTLLCTVPSHDADVDDEDTTEFKNNILFMVLKKRDDGEGMPEKIRKFGICQTEVFAIAQKLKEMYSSFNKNDCVFRNIDLNSIKITPIDHYFNALGYMLTFTNNTKF